MKDDKKHLDIDLGFLDKKDQAVSKPEAPKSSEPNWRIYDPKNTSPNSGKRYNWKNIAIVSGVVLFFGWVIFSNGDSSSTSNSNYTSPANTNTSNLLSDGGQTFRCSDSNYDRAMQLKPSASLGAQLSNESDSLDARIAANKAEKADIEGMYVDKSDQYAIDNYNSRVDAYNNERQSLIIDVNSWTQRHDAYSSQVDTYNNFLDTNCSPE
jgi:hypothetical protein